MSIVGKRTWKYQRGKIPNATENSYEFVYPFTYILFPALRFNICWVVSGDDVIVCDSHRHVAVKL